MCAVLAICTFSVNNSTMESLYRWRVMLVQMEILFNSDENAFLSLFLLVAMVFTISLLFQVLLVAISGKFANNTHPMASYIVGYAFL